MKKIMFNGILFIFYEIKELLLNYDIPRWIYYKIIFNLSRYAQQRKKTYAAIDYALRLEREISAVPAACVPKKLISFLEEYLATWPEGWHNLIVSYRNSELGKRHRNTYSSFPVEDRLRIRLPKSSSPPERQGDLLIMKPYIGKREKGVIYIAFDETVDKFFAFYNVDQMAQDYRFVFEPSAWGYQQVRMYLLRGLDTEVIVESQYKQDFEYIEKLGGSLHPIRLGAGDWVDPDIFSSGKRTEKKYDLVMVANWLKWKRHKLLFQAMQQLGDEIGRVALIGYSLDGSTSDEIRQIASKYDVLRKIDIYENISASEVAGILRSAKAGIMLSKKEGANRGIYECFFSDTPVILTSSNIGVNRDHLNESTGMLANEHELCNVIRVMCQKYDQFHPRDWAIQHTGWKNSTNRLNKFLREIALHQQENWTRDIFFHKNAPLPLYVDENHRLEADNEIKRLEKYLLA